ncbi:hypothetical protein FQR65_LT03952 [Abscondita terminalis]|nr:hypothetical protein FQR65_LT03952 [Abscondita terminalis]
MESPPRQLWGEIEDDSDSSSSCDSSLFPDVSADIEKSMNKFCLAEFDCDYHDNRFQKEEEVPFSLGEADDMCPELSPIIVKEILSKCTATMFAHIGFETTHQSILNVLVDVLSAFLKKMCYRLKLAYEDEQKGYVSGFPNIVERVLVELGMGGVKGLHDYYQTRIIKYIDVLQKRCKDLKKHYESLLVRKTPSPDSKENKIIRVNMEDEDVIEIDNPQVHLAIDGEVGFSSLDAGYQLLSSLEAGTSSQGLGETEEDTSITISPGVVSIPETDLTTTLSPYTKKKRTK